MKKLIQIILLVWFIVVNLLILGPSLYLLVAGGDDVQGQTPPSAPQPPAPVSIGPLETSLNLEQQKQQIEAYKQQVAAYGEQVKSYSQQVTAYTQQVSA